MFPWVVAFFSGAKGIRTPDLLIANETRYQLRHSPKLLMQNITRPRVVLAGSPFPADFVSNTFDPAGGSRRRRERSATLRADPECGIIDIRPTLWADICQPARGIPALVLALISDGIIGRPIVGIVVIRLHGDDAAHHQGRSCRIRCRRRFPSRRTCLTQRMPPAPQRASAW